MLINFTLTFFSNDSDDDDEAKESVTFNSKSHMDHLKIFFKYYGFEGVTSFAVVSKADSTRLNISLANILGIPHSPCDDRNLNLKVEDMHTNDQVLFELVEEDGRVGSSVRRICKKSEILRQFTNLRSITTFNTSCTGSLMCLSFHLKIYPGLEPIADEENSDDIWRKFLRHHIFVRSK